jgi:hypothetical protein
MLATGHLSAFRDRGVPEPTSEVSLHAPAQMGRREVEREGGKARWPEMGVREVEIPRPSCSSRAQVGCACSRGLQASTRGKERVASRERLSGGAEFAIFRGLARVRALGRAERSSPSSGA